MPVSTTQRYVHLKDSALRDATNVFGNVFAAAAKPKEKAEVIVLRKKGER